MKPFKISLVGFLYRLLSVVFYACIKEGLLYSLESKATIVNQTNVSRLFTDLIDFKGSLIPSYLHFNKSKLSFFDIHLSFNGLEAAIALHNQIIKH
jgi:hypothetical protein